MKHLPILFALLLLVGCGNQHDWAGVWRGNRSTPRPEGMSEGIYNTMRQIQVTIKPDGTFELREAGVPSTGSVRFNGDQALLSVKTFFGKDINTVRKDGAPSDIVLDWQKDGTLLFKDPEGLDPAPLVLKKEPQPAK